MCKGVCGEVCQEGSGAEDLDTLVGAELLKLAVTCDQAVRLRGDSGGQNKVVLRVGSHSQHLGSNRSAGRVLLEDGEEGADSPLI